MASRMFRWLRVGVLAGGLLTAACGDDEGGDMAPPVDNRSGPPTAASGSMAPPGMGPAQPSPGPMDSSGLQVCYDVCRAQQAAEMAGNCTRLTLATCQGICDTAEGGSCWDRLVALNTCQLTGEFACAFFSAESNADCDAEVQAYNSCFGL